MARGDGRIYPRGKTFWCCYYLRGEQHRESTETSDEQQARKFLRARLKEVHADEIGARTFITPKASRLTIAELTEALRADFELRGKLSPQNASHLRRVSADFGAKRAMELTSEKIDKYIEARLAGDDRPATINRCLQLLGQCFALAIRRGHLSRAPYVRHLSEAGNTRQGYLNPAEFQKVLAALPHDLKDYCAWAYATGQRKGEASKLTWDMVQGDVLRIPGGITKNGAARQLPLCGSLAEIIERRRAARRVEDNGTVRMVDVIFHRDGEPVREFRKSWATATRKAGVAGTRFHDLRRSAARNLTQAGVPREIAKKVTGHISDSMWDRYNIVISDDVRAALEKTEQYCETAAKQKVVAMR